MRGKASPVWTFVIITALFTGWQFYRNATRVSYIERAEFKVLYLSARNHLDAFSRCTSSWSPNGSSRSAVNIPLQKQFVKLRDEISISPFEDDRKISDLEIQVSDRNPATEMEDNDIRCIRLSYLKKNDEAGVMKSFHDLQRFLVKD